MCLLQKSSFNSSVIFKKLSFVTVFVQNKLFSKRVDINLRRKYPIDPKKAEQLPVFQYPISSEVDRRVYVWGLAEHGALGNYIQNKRKKFIKEYFCRPVRLHFAERHKVSDIACGYGFTAFAVNSKDKYKVFGCGVNTDSQIGYQEVRRNRPLGLLFAPVPIEIPFANPSAVHVKQIAAGRAHLLVLTDSEGVYSLGNNAYGQCGRKIIENEDYSTGAIIHNIPDLGGCNIEKVVCGQDHSVFINSAGHVYTCGWGADGQTGSGHFGNTGYPCKVKGDIEGETICKVASSVDCVLALNEKGEVFGWGNTEYGQLTSASGHVQQTTAIFLEQCRSIGRIVDIAAGGSFCIVVNEEGDVFVWGYGILGKGPQVDHSLEPTQIPSTLFGRNEFDPHTKVIGVNAGAAHIAALTNTGNLYMWGRNRGGCLGLGNNQDQFFPLRVAIGAYVKKISCGVDHNVALCKPFI